VLIQNLTFLDSRYQTSARHKDGGQAFGFQKRTTNYPLAWRGSSFEKGESGTLNRDIAEIERMLKALIKFLENKTLNP